jgi:hypothetical protein
VQLFLALGGGWEHTRAAHGSEHAAVKEGKDGHIAQVTHGE